MRLLRPLRLLVPLVAVGGALVIFLAFGFLAYQGGTGGGGRARPRVLRRGPAVGGPVRRAARRAPPRRPSATSSGRTRRRSSAWRGRRAHRPRAWLVALATAMQESTLRNINYGDRDSLGLFQQRPSQGWGTPAQVTDPVYSHHDLHRPAAAGAELGAAAGHGRRADRAAVGLPGRLREVGGAGRRPRLRSSRASPTPRAAGRTRRRWPRAWRARAIQFALGEVGKPYVWGATGPNTYDCSGLMLRAFQAAGIDLPRVSWQQFKAGGHVPVKQAQPGDLLFYATDPSDPATIHHVMLYMGDGQMVEAPYSGESVRVRPVPWGYSRAGASRDAPGDHAQPRLTLGGARSGVFDVPTRPCRRPPRRCRTTSTARPPAPRRTTSSCRGRWPSRCRCAGSRCSSGCWPTCTTPTPSCPGPTTRWCRAAGSGSWTSTTSSCRRPGT